MNLLEVSDNYYPNTDGVVISVKNIIKRLAKRHNVLLLTAKYESKYKDPKLKNVKIKRYNSKSLPSYENYRICLPNIIELSQEIKTFNPDIIHVHTIPGILAISCLILSKIHKIPTILTYHASYPDILVYTSPIKILKLNQLFDKIFSRDVKELVHEKIKSNIHITTLQKNIKELEKKLRSVSKKLRKPSRKKEPLSRKAIWVLTNRFFNRADLIIAPSLAIKKELKKHNAKPKIVVVSNGVETQLFKKKSVYHKNIRFLHVGRVGYEKKIEVLIKAFSRVVKKYPDTNLSIVGDGPAMLTIKELVNKLKIKENVKFYGYIPREKLPEIYQKHDVFLTASEMETQGLVLLEAMSSGLPAIGVKVLAIPDVVHHGKTGFLVKRKDYQKMAEYMIRFLENPSIIKKMGNNARKEAENHDVKKCVAKLEREYIKFSRKKYKVCLFEEIEKLIADSGLGTSFKNWQKALQKNNVEFTLDPKEDYEILHCNTIGPLSYIQVEKAIKSNKKVIISTHVTAEDFKKSFTLSTLISTPLKKYLRNIYSKADLLISPSQYTKKIIQSYGLKNKIEVLSNGIDLKQFEHDENKRKKFRKKYKLKGTVVFSVGAVFIRKGVIDFIDLAKKFSEHDFIWIGHHLTKLLVYYPKLEKAIQNAPDNFQFAGHVKDIKDAYAGGDIFLFPSYEENQGMVILEAATMKKPLIVRDLPVYKDWLFHEKNCLIAKNNKQFLECIKRLEKDTKLRKRLIENGYKLAKENSLLKVGKRLKNIYCSLIKNG